MLNFYSISNYFNCYCYKGSTFQQETIILLPLFQSKLLHIRHHRYGLCFNLIQRYSYSLFQLHINASYVTVANEIAINFIYDTKSFINRPALKAPTHDEPGLWQHWITDMRLVASPLSFIWGNQIQYKYSNCHINHELYHIFHFFSGFQYKT